VPAGFEALILRCLAKSAGERYPTAGALLVALSELRDTGSWTEADAHAWWSARGDDLIGGQRRSPLAHARTAAAQGH
jgi:hypothetical protein